MNCLTKELYAAGIIALLQNERLIMMDGRTLCHER